MAVPSALTKLPSVAKAVVVAEEAASVEAVVATIPVEEEAMVAEAVIIVRFQSLNKGFSFG